MWQEDARSAKERVIGAELEAISIEKGAENGGVVREPGAIFLWAR